MLSPDARAVAMDLLKPPTGYQLEQTVLTTYSMDLEALLALPLAVLAHADKGVEDLLEDPLLLLEALREAGARVQVFVDESGIAIPANTRTLYAALEPSVHPVRAPNGGAFHPKVWVARFTSEDGPPLLRVSVGSRNLTYDRSWDIAMVSEAEAGEKAVEESTDLAELIRSLPSWFSRTGSRDQASNLEHLADELQNTAFPAPDGFASPVTFHGLGLKGKGQPWQPAPAADRLLAIAPFVNKTGLDALHEICSGEKELVSRSDSLDAIADDTLDHWNEKLVLSEVMEGEAEDEEDASRPSGLHAKMLAMEHGNSVTWMAGSANITAAAFTGANLEMMASMTGQKQKGNTGLDIDAFRESGFEKLCDDWRRRAPPEQDEATLDAENRLEQARQALLDASLWVECHARDDEWQWRLLGELSLPDGVDAVVWPVSLDEGRAEPLKLPVERTLPVSRLSAFVAFRLTAESAREDVRLALKLPAEGIPDSRVHQILRSLIDSPERFLQFLRALLGGTDTLADWASDSGQSSWDKLAGAGLGGEPLLEDMLRAASRDPQRLEPIRRIIEDLRETDEGREIVPDDLYQLWQVVDSVLNEQRSE